MRRPAVLALATAISSLLTVTVVPSPASAARPNPAGFLDRVDNPYFPLKPGTTLVYRGAKDGEPAVDRFIVTDETKVILGVRCHVVHDRQFLSGRLAEDTVDWYAQDRHGNVWYYGEATKTLDENGHVISTEGSWQAGVDGAEPGIFMPGRPRVGDKYQQEFYKGHAEDHFRILSLSATVTLRYRNFHHTMKTKEWTPLEPDVVSNKYFAKGIGTVREVDIKGGDEHLDLVQVLREQSDDAD